MIHTWETNYLPKLALSNLERGDLLVCGLFGNQATILNELDSDRVAFVAPLHTRSDLEWLLRGLFFYPNIRQLVICGDDDYTTGEALLALWQQGLDESGQLPGLRGRISDVLDASLLDTLRSAVQLTDLRGKPLSEVANSIRDLPIASGERERQSLPDPKISERKVFHSRRTTFPMFASDVGDGWLQLLNLVLKIGAEKKVPTGERIAEALNAVVTIEVPELEDGEPLKKEEVFPEYFHFNSDDFERVIAPGFEKRLREWSGTDQLEVVFDRLRNSSDTRSGTMVFLEPGSTDECEINSANMTSGLLSVTFNVIDEKLFGSFVLQSTDIYTDWPIQSAALFRLQFQMAKRLGLEVGSATFVIHSAHLYERDWERSLGLLGEYFHRPLPLHVDPSGVFLFGNNGGKATAMLLAHDASQIFWEEGFSDPEDLSWYIVDTMPWLLPQHIRYVGQECASLMRSMKESECYLQG